MMDDHFKSIIVRALWIILNLLVKQLCLTEKDAWFKIAQEWGNDTEHWRK